MTITSLKSPEAAARWLREWVRGELRTDSRKVRPGDAFIAWPGHGVDGRKFVPAALDAGATTCVVEREGLQAFGFNDARIASLPGLKAAAGWIADAFHGAPSSQMDVVAVTGTNGKSSSAWWVAQALTLLDRRCLVVGTLGIGEPPLPGRASAIEFTGLTTPDQVLLHGALRRSVDAGFKACAIEASSIGIVEQRLAGLRIAVAVFTNFTPDHLDYHATMDAYWAAKRELFNWPGLRAAVINVDDVQGARLASELKGLDVWTCSVHGEARLRATGLRYEAQGLAFEAVEGEHTVTVRTTLIGDYNANNLLGVIGALRVLGITLADAAHVAPQLTAVPGRMQPVGSLHPSGMQRPQVVVDYAHTPDALDKATAALRPLAQARGGQLWCVFGCGGDRDASKRPVMGGIAERLADHVVITSDNPRHEAPQAILAQIVAGLQQPARATVIEDRRAAIAHALRQAHARDVVLIAGKGHEDYQDIAGVKLPFSDVQEAEAALAARGQEA
jgi:UDP-N-acetylmuramoyl-L-alanyl-D-glutamate--2,6-diaminopimelate ligase